MRELRIACARVAERARFVSIERSAIPTYAESLELDPPPPGADADPHLVSGTREQLTAFWLTLDAINFGSGWFPTLRKRAGRSGYFTVATGIRERFSRLGPWSAGELARIDAREVAETLGQDPDHELMGLFAASLCDLGRHVLREFGGRFESVVDSAGCSATALAELLAGWDCFADASPYDDFNVPFRKRAQIVAADLADAGVARFHDLGALTLFADNLVPHVLRLDGILMFDPALVRRIDRGTLIEHHSPEEVEIRACAVHAVELIVAHRPGSSAAQVDRVLWNRGQQPRYKGSPRHRSRSTAY
jgi:Potential Queuosine, Q, salvage protein family